MNVFGRPKNPEVPVTRIAVPSAVAFPLLATTPAGAQHADRVIETNLLDYRVVTVAEGLERPWSIAFLTNAVDDPESAPTRISRLEPAEPPAG